MAKNVKRKRSMDRISNLPDAVLCHILSFLPTEQAVGTSILSTRWTHLFASVTNLDFVYNRRPFRNITRFINFVDRVLFLHKTSCIDRFSLNFGKGINSSRINAWVCAVLWRNILELNLHGYVEESSILPGGLFTCKTLVVLKLCINFVLCVPSKVCLPSLKILHLDSIIFSDEVAIERLFSSCLVLEALVIVNCQSKSIRKLIISSHTLKRLEIECLTCNYYGIESCVNEIVVKAPSLVYLVYSDLRVDLYSFTELLSLVEARINFFHRSLDMFGFAGYDTFAEFFQGISKVRSLYLSSATMKAIQLCCNYPMPVFRNLTRLGIDADEDTLGQGLRYLLESSPNLETLVFKGFLYEHGKDWNPPEDVPSCLLFHLKEVEILKFKGQEREMKMVEYFLKNAKVLKKLMISTTANKKEQLKITKKLLMLPRVCSEACQVAFF